MALNITLQPHEASSPTRKSAWSPFCVVLLLLMGLAFPSCENTTLAFSNLMTPNNQIVTRNTTNNLASYIDFILFNQTNCTANTTSYVYDENGNEINNLTKINESGELAFNHTNLPLAQGIDRAFIFRAHSWLDNGSELDTGNRTIYLLGATETTEVENMMGEILIFIGLLAITCWMGAYSFYQKKDYVLGLTVFAMACILTMTGLLIGMDGATSGGYAQVAQLLGLLIVMMAYITQIGVFAVFIMFIIGLGWLTLTFYQKKKKEDIFQGK